jgi:26S proteasome regulatory subunit N11
MVVGWYHSHPGFGPWLSSVDINTQMSFEALNKRAVAVVIDPIQSVKGKVVIDAFRLISPHSMMLQQEPRQSTSNIGHLHKPSIVALIHGLNRHYYSMPIDYRKNELEQNMLMNVNREAWTGALGLKDFATHSVDNEAAARNILVLAEAYSKSLHEELVMNSEELKNRHVGKQDPKRHLQEKVESTVAVNVVQILGSMVNRKVF